MNIDALIQACEKKCDECQGAGRVGGDYPVQCYACGGFGTTLTPQGERLVEFLGRMGERAWSRMMSRSNPLCKPLTTAEPLWSGGPGMPYGS